MALNQKKAASAMEIDRLATQLAKDPHSKAFLPLAEEYCKVGMWEEAVAVLEDGLKYYPGFITAMVVLGRAYDQLNQLTKARAVLEGATKLSPENLRAHRILIKIYAAQGRKDEALKSCRVILAMNPRDEEALSVQASLGVQPEAEKAKIKAVTTPIKSAPPTAAPEAAAPASESEVDSKCVLEQSVPQTEEPITTSTTILAADSPISVATSIMEQALHDHGHQSLAKQASSETERPSAESSSHAGTIAQLESWLRSIQRQRRDGSSGDPDP